MSQQPPAPSGANFYGAVDLSAYRRPDAGPATGGTAGNPRAAAGAGAAPAAGDGIPVDSFVRAVDEKDFQEVVELSVHVPVVVDLWATWCEPCKQLSPVLEKLATEYDGAFLLATVDVDANQQLAQAFQAQSIPTVVAVIGGRPVPLFAGAHPEAQVREVLDQVVRLARQSGVTGSLVLRDGAGDDGAEPEIPPHHREALAALDRDDPDAAADAWRAALAEDPSDDEARVGLARVEVVVRARALDDPAGLRERAAADPHDVDAQLAVADLDLAGGHVEDAFGRLVALVAATRDDDRDRARRRLLGLFDAVGPDDERVARARTALANALY